MDVEEIQTALTTLGYKPGAVDGVMGRITIGEVKAFQKMHKLKVDGIVGAVTALALAKSVAKKLGKKQIIGLIVLPWMEEIMRRKGLHEARNLAALKKWLKSDGRTLGDPSILPWCGDAVETAIALTLPEEAIPTNPYLARNWLKFGRASEPVYGSIGVFWRGSKKGTSGHVGFINGETKTAYRVTGGNQNDMITDSALLAKDRLLGARWPSTFPFISPGKIQVSTGVVSENEA